MAKLTIAEELDLSIRQISAEFQGRPSREAAEHCYESEPDLIGAFEKEWVIEKIAALIRERRRIENRAKDRQYSLVGFRPPRRYLLLDGTKKEWGTSTLNELKVGRSAAWKRHKDYKHPAVRRFDKAIEFMARFSSRQAHITWEEALEKAKNRE